MTRFKTPLILLSIFFCLNLFDAKAQEQGQALKILSYNLRFGELASLEEFADFIKQVNPDMAALQEVDVNTFREIAPSQNGKNFISELAYRTNMLSLYGKTILYKGGYYGIGILSKYPYILSKRVLLPFPDGSKEQRAMLMSEIELPNGQIVLFVCTHLDYPTAEVRRTQIDFINEVLTNSEYPVILCGDFNAKPNYEEISKGMESWLQVSSNDFTVSAKNPKSKIDYIFCYPKERWEIISTETPKIQLSDHLPIVAEIRLK